MTALEQRAADAHGRRRPPLTTADRERVPWLGVVEAILVTGGFFGS